MSCRVTKKFKSRISGRTELTTITCLSSNRYFMRLRVLSGRQTDIYRRLQRCEIMTVGCHEYDWLFGHGIRLKVLYQLQGWDDQVVTIYTATLSL